MYANDTLVKPSPNATPRRSGRTTPVRASKGARKKAAPHEAPAGPPHPGLEGAALHTGLGRQRQSWRGTQGRGLSGRNGNGATEQTDGAGGRRTSE